MAKPKDTDLMKSFLTSLKRKGDQSGNTSLRNELDWTEDTYWRIHGKLLSDGKIITGRGKGGSVHTNKAKNGEAITSQKINKSDKEITLYEDLRKSLQENWLESRGYSRTMVTVTALLGRKDTGGSWTRPDITAIAVKPLLYHPQKIFDLITFEVKRKQEVNVKAVYEALSHRKSATYSYVLFPIGKVEFDKFIESTRIISASREHGVGVVLAEDTKDIETWEEILPAERAVSDPFLIDQFIGQIFDEKDKAKILKLK